MVSLKRQRSHVSLSPTVWVLTLELARVCGWNPQGTRTIAVADGSNIDSLEDVRHLMGWQTEYLSNDGQTVTAVDAAHLADSLVKAASDGERILTEWNEGRTVPVADVRTKATGFRWFSTHDGKDHLQTISDFCRRGAFQIY